MVLNLKWLALLGLAGTLALPAAETHWAFKAPVKAPEPSLKDDTRVSTAIDRFVIQRLEKEGLQLSPAADPVTVIRRLSLDLIGLPPAPKEVDEFLADKDAK